MKRKVYVKQMKMLKEKSKLNEHEKKDADKESVHSPANDNSARSPVARETSSVLEHDFSSSTSSSPSTSLTTSPRGSSSEWVSLNSTAAPKGGPLPKVDVLIKSSNRRAFQLRPTQGSSEKTPTKSSTHLIEDETNIQVVKREEPTDLSYVDNSPTQETTNIPEWVKDSSLTEQKSNASPMLAHSPYRVDYPGPYNVDLDQAGSHPNDSHDSQSSSPVFHQLQASQLSDRNINPDTADHHFEHRDTHGNHPYDVHGAGSVLLHQHQIPDNITRYNHEPTHNDIHDKLTQGHGQIRTWEQENYRYVDFTWRHDERMDCQESSYNSSADQESNDSSHSSTNFQVGASVLDESIDLSNKTTASRSVTKSSGGSSGGRRRRKRIQTPVQRSAANMRERRRMCHLNVAFDYLKEHLPNVKDKKKLSRIQTLKAAIYYIHLLQDSLNVH